MKKISDQVKVVKGVSRYKLGVEMWIGGGTNTKVVEYSVAVLSTE